MPPPAFKNVSNSYFVTGGSLASLKMQSSQISNFNLKGAPAGIGLLPQKGPMVRAPVAKMADDEMKSSNKNYGKPHSIPEIGKY